MLRSLLTVSLIIFFWTQSKADQYSLFKDEKNLKLVRTGGMFIYNEQPKQADSIINILTQRIPEHPVVPMMKALNIAWREMPMSMDSRYFKTHESHLKECVKLAERMYHDNPKGHDGIFFQIVGRGLMAEHYSNGNHYMRAVSEAKKIYGLIKKANEMVDENPDFLLSVGLYNYYREYYEENNPMMKPFLWFFRSGDKDLGLKQLEEATQKARLSKVEAYIYLSYIYLRYEKVPSKSIRLLEEIVVELPENNFIKTKLAECLVKRGEQDKAQVYCSDLIESDDPYYKMSGYILTALNLEKSKSADANKLKWNYEKGVETSDQVHQSKGKYLKCLARLKLAKIHISEDRIAEAKPLLEYVIENTDDNKLKKESKKILQDI